MIFPNIMKYFETVNLSVIKYTIEISINKYKFKINLKNLFRLAVLFYSHFVSFLEPL